MGKAIYQKTLEERGKKVWQIRIRKGRLIDSFRSFGAANKTFTKLKKEYFEKLELIRI